MKVMKMRMTLEGWDTILESLDKSISSIELDLDVWADDVQRTVELTDQLERFSQMHSTINAKRVQID